MDGLWSWYGQTPALCGPANRRYVNERPGLTLAPGPLKPGMNAPSDPGA